MYLAPGSMSDGIRGPWSFRVVGRGFQLSFFFTHSYATCQPYLSLSLSLCCCCLPTSKLYHSPLVTLSHCYRVSGTTLSHCYQVSGITLSHCYIIHYTVSAYQPICQLISLTSFLHSHTLFILFVISITLTAISLSISLSALQPVSLTLISYSVIYYLSSISSFITYYRLSAAAVSA